MPSFAEKFQLAQKTGLPVVEGFAAKRRNSAAFPDPFPELERILKHHLKGEWAGEETGDWIVLRLPPEIPPPPMATAWQIVRELENVPGIESAEPSLFVRSLEPSSSEARKAFGLWGRVSDRRAAEIAENSKGLHWAPAMLDLEGARNVWQDRHPGSEPGEGVLIAQLDTGYTDNPRFLPRLVPNPGGGFGKDFEDRHKSDARDPDAGFSGHGTRIGSVIVASKEDGKPWGVAPGARILPLRVSSSVIHMSFQNVCDAFAEAIRREVHVITMSLGGPLAFRQLSDRVRQALDAGIIVVSAAGNKLPGVVFPARLPGVVACAASNAVGRPWRWSGLGDEVTITAPGEQVWHEEAVRDGRLPVPPPGQGDGTSYATAHMAGLAALWLSYHGRDALIANHLGGRKELLPFLFRLCLKASAASTDFLKFGFGSGLARGRALLEVNLSSLAAAEDERRLVLGRAPDHVFRPQSLRKVLTLPTLTASMPAAPRGKESEKEEADRLEHFLTGQQGLVPDRISQLDSTDLAELTTLAASDLALAGLFANVAGMARHPFTGAGLRRYLLHRSGQLSPGLKSKLEQAALAAKDQFLAQHPELSGGAWQRTPTPGASPYCINPPPTRRLRAFAFDPSLAIDSENVGANAITIPVVFERDLQPGPVGDYLEVVDADPASDCVYAPVDLNHPYLLAQDGLPRAEGNPQFHQQMVYAVAMKTISHFENALGRPIFWSPLRPWDRSSGDLARAEPPADGEKATDAFVRRLRIYPHALREQNAYYSPQKRAVLFGYFPAGDSDPGAEYPGGVVFTCLAHDIVAHEVTHAILDGMHYRYIEPTNPDVFAFHEAFADIVALFQRFTYRELLEHQIARARGRLDAGTLMTRMALQFGQAVGRRQALRDALGTVVEESRQKSNHEFRERPRETDPNGEGPEPGIEDTARIFDEETRLMWKRYRADPAKLAQIEEPHQRGSFLVAAVFDAYLTIYENRIADLRRIATGGTGVLPDGDLHPDLVRRMAEEAAKAANHVLKICIRAMDYVPPTDITFGEYLRALITADYDLVPDDDRHYRVAFIEAFRKWGIYPLSVRTLSEESLRWAPPALPPAPVPAGMFVLLRRALFHWEPGAPRDRIFEHARKAQVELHKFLEDLPDSRTKREVLGGIDTHQPFQVSNLRPARRIGPRGEFRNEVVVEVTQRRRLAPPADRPDAELPAVPFTGGATLVIGFDEQDEQQFHIRYAIYKSFESAPREAQQREFLLRAAGGHTGAAEYSSQNLPDGWFTQEEVRRKWEAGRNQDCEAMRASSCSCRRQRIEGKEASRNEPFALLHRR